MKQETMPKKKIIRTAFDPTPEKGDVEIPDLTNDPFVIMKREMALKIIEESNLIGYLEDLEKKRNPAK